MIHLDFATYPKKQREILDWLSRAIEQGEVQVGGSLGTELGLAAKVKVSRNTVRATLGGLERAGVIHSVPHRGIFLLDTFDANSAPVQSNQEGQQEASSREYWHFRWCDSLMESRISHYLGEFAEANQLQFRVLNMHQNVKTLIGYLENIPANSTVILMPLYLQEVVGVLKQAIARGVRILQLDRYVPELDAPSVVFDHYAGAMLAVRHLLNVQCAPVWFLGYRNPKPAEQRYMAWRACMIAHGYTDVDSYEIICDADISDADQRPHDFYRRRLQEFWEKKRPESIAIFAMDELLAADVYAMAENYGLKVGRDVHIVSVGDSSFTSHLKPPHAIINNNMKLLCDSAAKLLLQWPEMPAYCQLLPVQMVE